MFLPESSAPFWEPERLGARRLMHTRGWPVGFRRVEPTGYDIAQVLGGNWYAYLFNHAIGGPFATEDEAKQFVEATYELQSS